MTIRRKQPVSVAAQPAAPAMSDEDFIRALYRACLGREADVSGLAGWTAQLKSTGDPTAVLAGLLASQEAHIHSGAKTAAACASLAPQAAARLGRNPRVIDIGAQLIGDGTHAYTPLVAFTPLDVIGFDPLADRMTERASSESAGAGSLTLLPYAIGDGASHTLHINNDDATTSLFPLNVEHNARFNHLATLHTVSTENLDTRRLDDVLEPGPVDFLKLDIQGGELMVLQHAARTLSATAVVHCEVEFSPIYAGQPLYPEIQTELAKYGFYLVDFVDQARYHFNTGPGATTDDQLVWADAVFFRETTDPEALAAQALIAAAVYQRPSLAEHLLGRATGSAG
jgi:FkbM family methyltransferase|nr:FkbM family methyltransferase [Aeromicrobium sp.]